MPTPVLYADQSRIVRPWRPALSAQLPTIARMYGQNATLEDDQQETDPIRKRLNELGAQATENTSTRGSEIMARLNRGSTTGQLRPNVPSEASANQQVTPNFGNPYIQQLQEIGRQGQIATQVQQARLNYQRLQQAANSTPRGNNSSGGFNLGSVPSGARQRAIKYAMSQLGVPYVWGGEQPGRGFDCSGLVQWAYGRAGIRLPRVSQDQMTRGVRTSISRLVPGDLIGWGQPAHHIAIYLGNGRILEAPRTGLNVRVVPLSQKGGGAWGIHLRI